MLPHKLSCINNAKFKKNVVSCVSSVRWGIKIFYFMFKTKNVIILRSGYVQVEQLQKQLKM